MKLTEEQIMQIKQELSDIDDVMCCDNSVSPYSFLFSQAKERKEYLENLLKTNQCI